MKRFMWKKIIIEYPWPKIIECIHRDSRKWWGSEFRPRLHNRPKIKTRQIPRNFELHGNIETPKT